MNNIIGKIREINYSYRTARTYRYMNQLPYGSKTLEFELPYEDIEVITPDAWKSARNAQEILEEALNNLLGSEENSRIDDLTGKKIGIAINDQTRPLPHAVILPKLLEYLIKNGADNEGITFYISTGTHRKLTIDEIEVVLPANLSKEYAWKCHNCDDDDALTYIGYTSMRNQVFVNKHYYQSDLKIVVGNIEPHHFMGFSGGVKSAAIGLTGRVTIEKNHSLLTHPNAKLGLFEENPMRMDVEEIGRMIGVDYALNVVLNDEKHIIAAFWGKPAQVMQAGIQVALRASQVDKKIEDCAYDLVIASVGGYPKDINLYQAQKALTNACLFSREKGVIILAAECRDGPGNRKFEEFMRNKRSWQQVIETFSRQPFQIGPHKAYMIARQAVEHEIILISSMTDEFVQSLLLTPAADIPAALKLARDSLPQNPRVVILPYATHSMPKS